MSASFDDVIPGNTRREWGNRIRGRDVGRRCASTVEHAAVDGSACGGYLPSRRRRARESQLREIIGLHAEIWLARVVDDTRPARAKAGLFVGVGS